MLPYISPPVGPSERGLQVLLYHLSSAGIIVRLLLKLGVWTAILYYLPTSTELLLDAYRFMFVPLSSIDLTVNLLWDWQIHIHYSSFYHGILVVSKLVLSI